MDLKRYWPDVVGDTDEFKEIAIIETPVIMDEWEAVSNLEADQWIQTATNKGLVRREKLLKLNVYADDTLETRRFRVMANWNLKLPYTYEWLVSWLDGLCGKGGYEVTLENDVYMITILLELTVKRMFEEVQKTARKLVPANMDLLVQLRYNTWNGLRKFTWDEASKFTWNQLKEEVMDR